MNKFRAKMKKQGGFTLVEMLIVVAIIAILIAISIPLINSALERARHATDAANERAAKAEALINHLGDTSDPSTGYYDAVQGKIVANGSSITPYGKHKVTGDDHTTKVLYVKFDDATATVTMAWVAPGEDEPTGGTFAAGICSSLKLDHKTTTSE